MNTSTLLLAASAWLSVSAAATPQALEAVCTLPDVADIVQRIGGDLVHVTTIARGTEDIHAVQLRPSHVVAVSRADCFFQIGLSLEHAWVPGLLSAARNSALQPGGTGLVTLSAGWEPIQVPETLSRRAGVDLHPEGNPHINLAPEGGRHMARVVHDALLVLRPEAREQLALNHAAFTAELDVAEVRWARLKEAARGTRVVVYHSEFDYFLQASGIEVAGTVEPKPGVPPTPRSLAELIETMRAVKVSLVLKPVWANARHVDDLCERTGAKRVDLPSMVGAAEEADSWIGLMECLHERVAEALGLEWPPEEKQKANEGVPVDARASDK